MYSCICILSWNAQLHLRFVLECTVASAFCPGVYSCIRILHFACSMDWLKHLPTYLWLQHCVRKKLLDCRQDSHSSASNYLCRLWLKTYVTHTHTQQRSVKQEKGSKQMLQILSHMVKCSSEVCKCTPLTQWVAQMHRCSNNAPILTHSLTWSKCAKQMPKCPNPQTHKNAQTKWRFNGTKQNGA